MKRILSKSFGGKLPPIEQYELDKILEQRLAEFAEARKVYFNRAISRLKEGPQMLPTWVELRGIFRYAHPLDSPAKWHEQQQECEHARQRLLAGENFPSVAREKSQGGSKNLGGKLGKRYLDPENPADQILAKMSAGDISPVVEVANGYWCYMLEAKESPQMSAFADAPWPARRLLFRQTLAAIIPQKTTK